MHIQREGKPRKENDNTKEKNKSPANHIIIATLMKPFPILTFF